MTEKFARASEAGAALPEHQMAVRRFYVSKETIKVR